MRTMVLKGPDLKPTGRWAASYALTDDGRVTGNGATASADLCAVVEWMREVAAMADARGDAVAGRLP